nr:MAG TPA: Integrase [Caudoviricetes sp.]
MLYISSNKYNIQERKTKLRGKVYDVVFRVVTEDGTEIQKKLSGYETKALAKAAYLSFVTENCSIWKQNPLKKKKAVEKGKSTFKVKELLPIYVNAIVNQNKESVVWDRKLILTNFVLPAFGEKQVNAITKEDLYKWQDELWQRKNPRTNEYLSSHYLLKIRQSFSMFLDFAESRYGVKNLLKEVKPPKKRESKPVMQFWTKADFEKFIKVVDDKMYRTLFSVLFYTGRRKSEVLALTPGDLKISHINFNKSLTIRTLDGSPYKITSTKADKCYTTPICDTLWDELCSYAPQSPFLFGGDKPVAYETLRRKFAEYTQKAGLKPIRIHDLRHSFVSMCIHLGANFMVVADLIGDTVEQVTKTYGHMYETDKQKIVDLIG